MSLKLLEAVYRGNHEASSSEQAVLVALAYRTNSKDGRCFPSQKTLADMTRLDRSSINRCLNQLRDKGYLTWISGGLKTRTKSGQPKANAYTLTLPKPIPRTAGTEGDACTECEQDLNKTAQTGTAMSHGATRQCLALKHGNVSVCDTNRNENKIKGTESRPSEGGDGWEGALEEVLGSMGVDPAPTQAERREAQLGNARAESPVARALRLCGFRQGSAEWKANATSFRNEMFRLGGPRSVEIIGELESEIRQGKAKGVRSLAAVLMARLKAACKRA